MHGVRSELVQGLVALLAAIGAFVLAPALTDVLGLKGSELIARVIEAALALIVGGSALLLSSARLVRTWFDDRASFIGQYVDYAPKTGILSVATLDFDADHQTYVLSGTAIDPKNPGRPEGTWSTIAMEFDLENDVISYLYSGIGTVSRATGSPRTRGVGLTLMDFFDDGRTRGEGRFRDLEENSLLVETKFERINAVMIRKHLGKRRSRLTQYDDIKKFLLSYNASINPPAAGGPKASAKKLAWADFALLRRQA